MTESRRGDLVAMQLRHELQAFLEQAIADGGKTDGGGGMGAEDIWLTVGGQQIHIRIDWPEAGQRV